MEGGGCTPRPVIFKRYLDPETVKMFGDLGIYTEVELEARTEVKWETYVKKIQIEARVLGDLAMNHIVPIASKYESVLLDKAYKLKELGMPSTSDIELIKRIQQMTIDMIEARKVANKIESMYDKAMAYHDTVEVYFEKIRKHIDRLEEVVDDQLWTLPKYRELLFIK